MEETVRMRLVWAPAGAPLGLLIGGSASRCWVEVGPDAVTAAFGPLAEARAPVGRHQQRPGDPLVVGGGATGSAGTAGMPPHSWAAAGVSWS